MAMRRYLFLTGILVALLMVLAPTPITAQAPMGVTNNRATLKFPDWIQFSVDLKSDVEIRRVDLEYGVDRLTCGQVISTAFPKVSSSKSVTARWTWEMKQSGSEPPGADVWWRWRVTTADGKESVTETMKVKWLDNAHKWQTIGNDQLRSHWYSGDKAFATELHNSAVKSLRDLERTTGVKPEAPINLYVYATSQDMREAMLYAPSWTGGRAYAP